MWAALNRFLFTIYSRVRLRLQFNLMQESFETRWTIYWSGEIIHKFKRFIFNSVFLNTFGHTSPVRVIRIYHFQVWNHLENSSIHFVLNFRRHLVLVNGSHSHRCYADNLFIISPSFHFPLTRRKKLILCCESALKHHMRVRHCTHCDNI